MNSTVKHLLIWVLTVAVLLMGWKFVTMNIATGHDKAQTVTEVQNDVDANKVDSVTINGAQWTNFDEESVTLQLTPAEVICSSV